MFLQKIETKGDGFKLHNMVADKNNLTEKGESCGRFCLFLSATICSLKPSHLIILSAFSICHDNCFLSKFNMKSRFFLHI